jgi:NTE family protein
MTEKNSKHFKDLKIPDKQRALVLQGGGALGAYEVGVLKVLCKKLPESGGTNMENGPLFDVIAGSSMGAMNAAVLVSNVVNRHKSWQEAVQVLEDFWVNQQYGLSSTPDISKWLKDEEKQKMFRASKEALRRYYSVKAYKEQGTPNVCSAPEAEVDYKYADSDPLYKWYLHDIDPLQNTIEGYSKDKGNEKLRIATSMSKREPRLLVISVDAGEGKTVAFDSYHTKDDSKNSVYESDGITIDHIMASGTIPIFYKFRVIDGRSFYDGGFLNNTPFRELLQAHREYWTKVIGDVKAKIPDLDVYIINVHPPKKDTIPTDYDGANDRLTDITYSDRNSRYDEMVTHLITDYHDQKDTLHECIELINKLKSLKNQLTNTSEGSTFQNEIEPLIMTIEGKMEACKYRQEKYKDLIKGKFKLTKVVRIERTSDIDTSTGKEADYSSKSIDFTYDSIKKLIEQGEEDAHEVLEC